jgi:16S rRNA (guanine527-N7)-methyltransferase
MGDVWRRHILDAAQLYPHIPAGTRVAVDLGSGAGLPGLVLKIMGVPEMHLVESDQRKAAFLREAVRVTGAPAIIHPVRIEAMPPISADLVTARALAPLPELLRLAAPFVAPAGLCLLLKGKTADAELTEAGKEWNMRAQQFPSISDPSGRLLKLESLVRAPRTGSDCADRR